MALHVIPTEELRAFCRQRLESCELWLRRLVHDALSDAFGPNYIETAALNGQALFRAEIRRHVACRMKNGGSRYSRAIDTLLLDHLSVVICKQDAFKKYFAPAMSHAFPLGNETMRLVFNRLVPIRNALSHANPITLHDAERVFCYCDDIISSLTEHYASRGMSKEFDAPSFTRYSDSLGRVEYPAKTQEQLNYTKGTPFRSGDAIRLEVDVDAHYAPNDYVVRWQVANIPKAEYGLGRQFSLTLSPRHVSESFAIFVTVTSNREWHRHGAFDAKLVLVYSVLPPI